MFDQAGCDEDAGDRADDPACDPVVDPVGLRDVGDRCRKAAREDVSLASDDGLRDLVVEVERARAALDAVEGHALAVLERRGSCDVDVGMSTASWLAWATRGSRRACSVRVRTALAVDRLDVLDVALGEGELGYEHADVLGRALGNRRVAEEVVVNHGELVELARKVPFELWRRAVDDLVRLWDQDSRFDPGRDRVRNRLNFRQVGDTTVVRGELVGELAVVVRQAIESMADTLWRRAQADQHETPEVPVPTRPTLRAEALAELCRHGLAAQAADGAAISGPVVDITLVIRDDDPDAVRTSNGERLDPAGVGHLLCDAVWRLLRCDERGVPLDLGHDVRHASRAQRRALAARDGGCVFPGCDRPVSWCDAHHVVAHHHRGPTDIANLALLCRHHHGVTHRQGWTMVANPDQTFTWTTPSGRTLHSQRQHTPTHAPP